MKLEEFLNCNHDIDCDASMTKLYCQKCGQDANVIEHISHLKALLKQARPFAEECTRFLGLGIDAKKWLNAVKGIK